MAMEATLSLHQAGHQLGVDDTTLSRLIRIGAIPEARKVQQPDGPVWVIPAEHLPAIATRNGWTIDLRDPDGPVLEIADTVDDVDQADEGPTEPEPEPPRAPVPPAAPGRNGVATPLARGALVPHRGAVPEAVSGDAAPAPVDVAEAITPADGGETGGAPSVAEVLDLALLDRLLGEQEQRLTAQSDARESKHALTALNVAHNQATGELEVERRERLIAADRYREERMARAVADAKVAELRDRVVREMALADAEKQARAEAMARSIRAERDNANALAAMGWLAKRRYRRLSTGGD